METAQSAMRNLNNHDFNGRPLRVGVAAGEQNKDKIKSKELLSYLIPQIIKYCNTENKMALITDRLHLFIRQQITKFSYLYFRYATSARRTTS